MAQHEQGGHFLIPPISPSREVLLLFVISFTNFMIQVGNTQGINPDYIIAESFGADTTDVACFPASCSLISFLCIETKVPQPLHLVNKPPNDVAYVLTITSLGQSSFGIFIYCLINFTTQLRGDTPLSVAAQIVPVPFSGLAASLFTFFLLSRGVSHHTTYHCQCSFSAQ
ncbi:hypothetical protein BDZ45DRAFT_749460 [Acephala macrosclerotiorum]|nr:hypothetical protein BDZ45DRAFT_749460 [Acephala macrosclerotiorum]